METLSALFSCYYLNYDIITSLNIQRAEGAKTFPGPCYLRSEYRKVWLWHFLINLYIYGLPFHVAATQSQCLMCGIVVWAKFAWQQRVLETFPGTVYLLSKGGVVSL